jgi:hypothetical protein
MKKALLILLVAAACSGQLCGPTASDDGLDYSGRQNICGRSYFNSKYRVGVNLPEGTGSPDSGATDNNIALKLTWDWTGTEPAAKFILVVSANIGDVGLAQVAQDSKATYEQNNFNVMSDFSLKLDDEGDAWYFALSPKAQDNINLELIMTVSQGRLVTLSATYPSTLSQAQTDAIGAALHSLCADMQ